MPLLVESLRAVDGSYDDPGPHIRRMNRSTRELFGVPAPDLEAALNSLRPPPGPGEWKVRVLYDSEIREVRAAPYRPRAYRNAVLLDGGDVDYHNKLADRPVLDALTARARELGGDTALILRDGLITDFSWANAAFFDGSGWWTPSRPLLEGTRRERLLEDGILSAADIRPRDLEKFSRVSLVNAMLELDREAIPVSAISGPFRGTGDNRSDVDN